MLTGVEGRLAGCSERPAQVEVLLLILFRVLVLVASVDSVEAVGSSNTDEVVFQPGVVRMGHCPRICGPGCVDAWGLPVGSCCWAC